MKGELYILTNSVFGINCLIILIKTIAALSLVSRCFKLASQLSASSIITPKSFIFGSFLSFFEPIFNCKPQFSGLDLAQVNLAVLF